MSPTFDPQAFAALTIDDYDYADGTFTAHYTLRGIDAADDVAFAERVDFGLVDASDDVNEGAGTLVDVRVLAQRLDGLVRHSGQIVFDLDFFDVTSLNDARGGAHAEALLMVTEGRAAGNCRLAMFPSEPLQMRFRSRTRPQCRLRFAGDLSTEAPAASPRSFPCACTRPRPRPSTLDLPPSTYQN